MATSSSPTTPRIVVGVDGSPSSLAALRWSKYLAPLVGAEIEAITTWKVPPALLAGSLFDPDVLEQIARSTLESAVRDVFDGSVQTKVVQTTREASPVDCLVEASSSATLVLVGNRGRGGFAGMVIGSVSSAVAAHAHCPVLVVHGDTVPVG
ncbi:universal stress protein [Microlunatus sp. Gsoil 973]|jgi:nucleotide-binding universal stress UspA family protein|uniref:universal stress protein n=1 Tax=Microlunatus sp. Gsoil 973 TaxID=2672569 RepID=UPI0012B4E5A6|nr:universal stress protein [Microlunatus sp. Gsoil 973]QGN33508.1 universal stress protein [Microlunatus sp. Gsoil 973]